MKIVHLSDPHLSRQFYREHLKSFKILLRSILERGCDHLIITGDLVSTADEDDYLLAREILGSMGLLDSRKLTVVPGNHDIFGGPHRATDVLSFPQHIRSVDYERHLDQFQRVFRETFDNAVPFGRVSLFPFAKRVGPYSVIGLNSVPPWSLSKNPLGTNGMLNQEHLDGLAHMREDGILKGTIPIVALHHHFNDYKPESGPPTWWTKIEANTMRMRERKKALRLFTTLGVRYVLHGHIHRNELYQRNETTLLNGAGAVCDDPIEYLKYNELIYQNGSVQVRMNLLPIPYQKSSTAIERTRLRYSLPVVESPLPANRPL